MATWMGKRCDVVRITPDGNWVTVKMLEKSAWFGRGEKVCVSSTHVRMPVLKERRVPLK